MPTPESLYRQALAAGKKGDTKTVLAITLEAQKRFGDSDEERVWWLRCTRAKALVNYGKSDEALALLQRPLPPSLRGTEIEVVCLQAQAFASKRPEPAESIIAKAYALAKEKHPKNIVEVLVLRMIIDPSNAAKWGAEALRLAKRYPDAFAESRARGQMALELARSERFDEAINLWEPGLANARKLGNEAFVEKFEGNLGWGYMELGDYETAGDLFRRAQATALRIDQKIDAVTWTYQLGNIRFQEGDLAGAEKQYRLAYDLAMASTHPQLSSVLVSLARYELRVGRLSEAQRNADRSLAEAKNVEDELRARLIGGRIAAAGRRFDDGERLLDDVIKRTGSQLTKLEAHGRLAQLQEQRGNFVDAQKQFELSTKVARKSRDEVGDMELRFSFFNAVEELFDSYVDFLIARGRDAEALAVTESSRAQTLEEALPDLAAPRDVRVIARDTGATILCYWLGGAQSYLWVVTPQKIVLFKLPPKRVIESAVDAYQRDLLGPRGTLAGSGSRGTALWRMLVGPASRSIAPGSRVIIVPHGRLNAFNMETLVVPEPNPHYWIDDVISTTAGSLGLLVRKEPKRRAAPRLLLVGNAPPPNSSFPPLKHARAELDKVKQHFDRERTVVLDGAKATPSAYRSASPEGFTYLHFVAHGVATRQKPMVSAVVLAREGETFKLYARDIAKQPLHATLVTISSCHGAGTRTYAGEGLVGLGWAFLRAGAENVVASLWEVSDVATPKLMDRFYAELAKGTDPAVALRDAKIALKAEGGVFARPWYWAPFLLYGSS